MSDRFGWTLNDWDALTPQARGNLIANLDYWANKREEEQKELEKKSRQKHG